MLEARTMTLIKPVSDFRNYNDILKDVDNGNRVYLTRNGHGAYVMMSIDDADHYEQLKAAYSVMNDLHRAEQESDAVSWVNETEMKKIMGIDE